MHAFGTAVEAGDIDAAIALLGEDVVFRSPIVHRPYQGRDAVAHLLRAVWRVFSDFRYVRVIGADDAPDQALIFTTRVGDREIEGTDFIRTGPDGTIEELMVMVRPLTGALALAEAMKAELEASGA